MLHRTDMSHGKHKVHACVEETFPKPKKTQTVFTSSIQWRSVNQTYCMCVCVQGKHSDCMIFASAAPAKTQHINYVLTAQPNRVYNSLQVNGNILS